MTRDEVRATIAKVFQEIYQKDFYAVDEDSPIGSLSEIDARIDSLEIIEFLFVLEDTFKIDGLDVSNHKDVKISTIIDIIYNQINRDAT